MWSVLTVADKVLILVLVLAVGASTFGVHLSTGEGKTVLVRQNGSIVYTLNLHEQRTLTLQGRLGPVEIQTANGRVAIIHSSCPNHICVRTGWRSKAGEVIVCVPNNIFVRISGRQETGVRAVTG